MNDDRAEGASPEQAPASASTPAPSPGHQSIGSLSGALWRRKLWVLIPTLAAFLASLAIVNILTPRYTGEARVLLENRDTIYSRPDRDASAPAVTIDPEAVASQVQNVMSKDLALDIIRELGLARRAEYDPVQKGLGLTGSVLLLSGLIKDPRQIPQEERVLEMYYKRLLAYPLGRSRVIAIEFQSEDPKIAADVANRIAEEYLKREEGAKNQNSRVTSDWLDKAIEPLMQKVVAAEGRVEAFRASKGLFIGANNTSISTQQLAELNTQLSTARAQQADLAARAKVIREALRLGRIFETSEVINNDLVRRLLEQRAALKAQIAFEERTLLPGHPRMKELGGQLADLESQVRAAAERAARAFDNDARAAGARVTSMQAELDSQKKTTALSNEDEVQMKALEREALALREQLNSYRNKFLDAAARATENAQTADARIISRAFPQSDPTFPKKIPIVLLATLATLVLTATLIAAQALMARQGPADQGEFDYAYGMPQAGWQGREAHLAAPWMTAAPKTAPPETAAPPAPPAPHMPPASADLPWAAGQPSERSGLLGRLRDALGRKAGSEPAGGQGAAEPFIPHPPAAMPISRERSGAAEDLARELALMDFHGQGKIILVFGFGREVRASLSALRIARRLALDGASILVDLCGAGAGGRGSNLYARLVGPGAAGLNAYFDRVASFGDVIHRDSRSPLHVMPAGAPLHARLAAARSRGEIETLVVALRHAYSHVVIDCGAIGGAGEFVAGLGDAITLVADPAEDEHFITRTIARLEGYAGAPVFLIADEGGAEYIAANDAAAPETRGTA
jgi:uncharacterized protein involved in exopolysaccharide biosynthesis